MRHWHIVNFETDAEEIPMDMILAQILNDVPRDAAMAKV